MRVLDMVRNGPEFHKFLIIKVYERLDVKYIGELNIKRTKVLIKFLPLQRKNNLGRGNFLTILQLNLLSNIAFIGSLEIIGI